MKKRCLKPLLLVGFGGVALAIVAGFCLRARPAMRFRFLKGRRPVWRRDMGSHTRWRNETWDYYRFEADFNEVYAKATAELTARGFTKDGVTSRAVAYYRGIDVGIGRRRHYFESVRPTSVVWVLMAESDGWVYVRVGSAHAGIRERLRHWIGRPKRRRPPPPGRTVTGPQAGQ
jgi:hypothetical protein